MGIAGQGMFKLALDCRVVEGGNIEPDHGCEDVYGVVVLYAKVERGGDALPEGGQQAFGDGGQEGTDDDGDKKVWIDCTLVDRCLDNGKELPRVGEMDGRDDGYEELEGEEGEEKGRTGGDGRDVAEHAGKGICARGPSDARLVVRFVLVEVPETDAGVLYIVNHN